MGQCYEGDGCIEAIEEARKAGRTDTERLDWLQAQSSGYGGWIARMSTTGRGFRLHESENPLARPTVREAIDLAMDEEEH